MRAGLIVLAILAFGGWLASSSGRTVFAITATPTPTPATTAAGTQTPTQTATPFPPGTTVLHIRIVDDRDASGSVDAGDAGLEGWTVILTCGDVLFPSEPSGTNGFITALPVSSSPADGGMAETCAYVQHRRGWIDTNPTPAGRTIVDGAVNEIVFLLHYLGDSTMEVSFDVIVAGVPQDAAVELAPPYGACARAVYPSTAWLAIVGAADRSGCPAEGSRLQFTVNGLVGGEATFRGGTSSGGTLVVGGDSMRFRVAWDNDGVPQITSATIDGRDCAGVDPSLPFPGGTGVYVLSDEARAGCGTPGDIVRFYRDGVQLEPPLEWQAGQLADVPESFTAAATTITPPNTGSGGLLGSR